jgi:gluconate 2-dehydrogenase gamma chain
MSKAMNRRKFFKTLGTAGAVTVLSGDLQGCQTNPPPAATNTPVPTAPPPTATQAPAAPTAAPAAAPAASAPMAVDTYTFFTDPESAFVESAVARLIPQDDLGPGAFEAGVSYFLDHQLGSAYGIFSRHYTLGPWKQGAPEQGYQLRLVPREIYRLGISETNAYCIATFQKAFDQLTPAQQDDVLKGLEAGSIQLLSVPAALFFSTLRNDTVDGFFADPAYGGNRDKVAWKLVGYPGIPGSYKDFITKQNEPYTGPIRSIADAEGAAH